MPLCLYVSLCVIVCSKDMEDAYVSFCVIVCVYLCPLVGSVISYIQMPAGLRSEDVFIS